MCSLFIVVIDFFKSTIWQLGEVPSQEEAYLLSYNTIIISVFFFCNSDFCQSFFLKVNGIHDKMAVFIIPYLDIESEEEIESIDSEAELDLKGSL